MTNEINFIDSENNLSFLLTENKKGKLSQKDKDKRIKAINDYFNFATGYTLNSLAGLIRKNMTTDHKKRKIKKFLSVHKDIKIKEMLQIDTPKKENYVQNVNIGYGYGNVEVLRSRYRYGQRHIKVAVIE